MHTDTEHEQQGQSSGQRDVTNNGINIYSFVIDGLKKELGNLKAVITRQQKDLEILRERLATLEDKSRKKSDVVNENNEHSVAAQVDNGSRGSSISVITIIDENGDEPKNGIVQWGIAPGCFVVELSPKRFD